MALIANVKVPNEVASKGALAEPMDPPELMLRVPADMLELSTPEILPDAVRVTEPGAAILLKITPELLLNTLARSILPFQLTEMFPAELVALRANVLLEVAPSAR